jgi:hypothetical protein
MNGKSASVRSRSWLFFRGRIIDVTSAAVKALGQAYA